MRTCFFRAVGSYYLLFGLGSFARYIVQKIKRTHPILGRLCWEHRLILGTRFEQHRSLLDVEIKTQETNMHDFVVLRVT